MTERLDLSDRDNFWKLYGESLYPFPLEGDTDHAVDLIFQLFTDGRVRAADFLEGGIDGEFIDENADRSLESARRLANKIAEENGWELCDEDEMTKRNWRYLIRIGVAVPIEKGD